MKKRHNPQARNNNGVGSSPDERQRSLLPGTDEYKARQAMQRLKEAYGVQDDAKEAEPAPPPPKPVVKKEEPQKDMAHDVAVRKFRRRRSKERQAARIKADLDAALSTDTVVGDGIEITNPFNIPGVKSMDEEVYDDGVDEKAFANDVVRDYESDIKELMNTDNDKDGDVDEDDITPAMTKLHKKYM